MTITATTRTQNVLVKASVIKLTLTAEIARDIANQLSAIGGPAADLVEALNAQLAAPTGE